MSVRFIEDILCQLVKAKMTKDLVLKSNCGSYKAGDDEMGMGTTPHHFNVTVVEELDYEEHLDPVTSDLWIGIVLILMILSCVGCVCSCLLYHKFQQWKHHERRAETDPECPRRASNDSLPSYTLVTGLPTYDQAMEAARKGQLTQLSPASLVLLYPQPPPPFSEISETTKS